MQVKELFVFLKRKRVRFFIAVTDEGIQEHLEQASEFLKHDMALRPDDADDETGNP